MRPGCSDVMGIGHVEGERFSVDMGSKACDWERMLEVASVSYSQMNELGGIYRWNTRSRQGS